MPANPYPTAPTGRARRTRIRAHRIRLAARAPAGAGQDGMMTAELVILVVIVLFFLLLVTGLGRYSRGRQLVQDTSAAAARAASLASSPAQASADARQVATDTLRQGGISCQRASVVVDLHAFGPGGQVSVTIHCTAGLSDLAMTGLPATATLSATSTSPLDTYRVYHP